MKNLSSAQFDGVQMPSLPRSHSAMDNATGGQRARPEQQRSLYREPANGGGAAWQPSNVGTGRPVTPFSASYFRPIVTA